jgi:pimeloyl-ACP methyl ester carboxylesterase
MRKTRFGVVLVAPVLALALAISGCSSSSSSSSTKSSSVDRQKQVRSSSTNVAHKDCGTSCVGEIDGAKYEIRVPASWNGTLLLYSHGYRFAQPGPPDFGPVSTRAQVDSTDTDGTGSDPLAKDLLAKGYALAGSSYKTNGWAVSDGVKAGDDLHSKFVQLVGAPQRTYVWGDSLGGLITELIAEKHAEWVDGAAPMCGALAGPNLNFDAALDVAFAVKTLIDPSLKLVGYSSADDAANNWKQAAQAVETAAADTAGGGTAKVLLVGDLVDAPLKSEMFDGSSITSTVKALVESILTALAFGTSGRYELEQRVGGNPSDNTKADYDSRVGGSEKSLITLGGGDSAKLLAQLDAAPRVSADAKARSAFENLGDTTGKLRVPTATLHTEDDPLVLVANETIFSNRVKAAGTSADLSQFYIAPPASYPQDPGAPYGAGHCNFNNTQREALISTLDAWVRGGPQPTPSSAGGAFGAGFDPYFIPGTWPSGATT